MPVSIAPPPAENEIECARCGAYVDMSLSRCPNCGVNLYEPEDDEDYARPVYQGSGDFLSKAKTFFRRKLGLETHPAEMFVAEAHRQISLYQDLLRKVGGEKDVVERLVAFEKHLAPDATRITCLENALRRWEQDNR